MKKDLFVLPIHPKHPKTNTDTTLKYLAASRNPHSDYNRRRLFCTKLTRFSTSVYCNENMIQYKNKVPNTRRQNIPASLITNLNEYE